MSNWWLEFQQTLLDPWAVLGFSAQALFFSRWIVQWFVSEKRKESHVPLSFWVISLIGGIALLVYAVKESQPVFIFGQLVGVANYARNISLIRKRAALERLAVDGGGVAI